MRPSRTSLQNTLQSFGDISRFLREGVADEESRQLRESLGALSSHIEQAVRGRRKAPDAPTLAQQAAALCQAVRDHQRFLTGLGSAWHTLYELGVYQRALRELLQAVQAWQQSLERRSSSEADLFRRFEMLAWRTLGEALLLIDMYEHQGDAPPPVSSSPAPSESPTPALQRLCAWLGWSRKRL